MYLEISLILIFFISNADTIIIDVIYTMVVIEKYYVLKVSC